MTLNDWPSNVPIIPANATNQICTCGGTALCHSPQSRKNLTRRETQILDLVARGRTFTDIADYFDISTETVRTLMKRVHRKLGAKNSAHAVSIGLTLRLICPAAPEAW